ncbi:hypothetical protein FF38_05492 [Lucilia cuprina]|uniref:Uncharacterized protein n=1 Tax=Lucilia cuprina TaxID=7375 RepID=A0A0L0C4T1_LUCCU|nr:hypothetical protein FF38_05492 [Lucilia cuprina]
MSNCQRHKTFIALLITRVASYNIHIFHTKTQLYIFRLKYFRTVLAEHRFSTNISEVNLRKITDLSSCKLVDMVSTIIRSNHANTLTPYLYLTLAMVLILFAQIMTTFLNIQLNSWQFIILLCAHKQQFIATFTPRFTDMYGFVVMIFWTGHYPT